MEDAVEKWKDKLSPHKHLSGYQLLFKDPLEMLKERDPGGCLDLPLVSKLCGERWRGLDERTRKIFQMVADQVNEAAKPNAKAPKRGQLPKRPLSSFILFCKDMRGDVKTMHPERSMAEISADLSQMWAEAEPEVKEKYKEMSNKQREKYKQLKEAREAKAAKKAGPPPVQTERMERTINWHSKQAR